MSGLRRGPRFVDLRALDVSVSTSEERGLNVSVLVVTTSSHGSLIAQEGEKSQSESKEEDRMEILRQVAKACKQQGSYHLACKKYTQVRPRLGAINQRVRGGKRASVGATGLYYGATEGGTGQATCGLEGGCQEGRSSQS